MGSVADAAQFVSGSRCTRLRAGRFKLRVSAPIAMCNPAEWHCEQYRVRTAPISAGQFGRDSAHIALKSHCNAEQRPQPSDGYDFIVVVAGGGERADRDELRRR